MQHYDKQVHLEVVEDPEVQEVQADQEEHPW
jgi:hypothetical protein